MPKITFSTSGNSLLLAQGDELLELETRSGNELPFGCKQAICGTCALKVISGMQNLNPKNQDEEELLDALNINDEDHRLGCQCMIFGDIKIDPIN